MREGAWYFGGNKNSFLGSRLQIAEWENVGRKRLEIMKSHVNLATEFELERISESLWALCRLVIGF